MDNTPSHVGREQTITALGREWTLARWDRRVWADFLDWAKTVLPNPAAEAAAFLALVPPSDEVTRRAIVAEALKCKMDYLSVASPRVVDLIGTLEGTTKLVAILLQKHQPGTTDETAYEIITSAGKDRMQDVLQACAGVLPKKDEPPGESFPTG